MKSCVEIVRGCKTVVRAMRNLRTSTRIRDDPADTTYDTHRDR